MRKSYAIIVLTVLLLSVLNPGAGLLAAEGGKEPEPAASEPLPLKRVVLFSSGVGYFEHQGTVEGRSGRTFRFLPEQMQDILKSMVFLDGGGGSVRAITYDGMESAERALGSFIVDLTGNPGLPEILFQLRGRDAVIQAAETVRGAIVSVEHRTIVRDEGEEEQYLLLVLAPDGLRRIALDEIRSISFVDAEVEKEFRGALALLARTGSRERKGVEVLLDGNGRRPVRIGYLLEAPVWKASYRLVLGDGENAYLQGWALVDNAGEEDWTDVSLSLVSGRPVSFSMDLYRPVYVPRPEIAPDYLAGVVPPVYRDTLSEAAKSRSGAAAAPAPSMAPSSRMAREYAEPAAEAELADDAFGIGGGVTVAAAGQATGELFSYAVGRPVTIPRQRSAMIPIIGADLPGRKLSIYRQADNSRYPYNGVQLRNGTGLHLAPGPLTVFEDGVYAGDARIEHLPPEGERLVSYSLDLSTEVAVRTDQEPEELYSVKIVRGTLVSEHLQKLRSIYTIRSKRQTARTLLIEQPFRPGWELSAASSADGKTGDAYRFFVELSPGAALEKQVEEKRVISRSVALSNLDSGRILVYLQAKEIAPDVERALRKVADMNRVIAETAGERSGIEEQVRQIHQEQSRIRGNMGSLDRNSDLYRRYVSVLTAQEDELRKLNDAAAELREREQRLIRDRDRFLGELS